MSESNPNLTKIEIHTPHQDSVDIETPWVEPLGDDRYRIVNLPFFAYELSLGDVVKAQPTEDSKHPVLKHMVEKSGRRLLRSRFDTTSVGIEVHKEHFAELGCVCELFLGDSIGIDVPADVSLGCIAEYLLQHATDWEFADPTYPKLYKSRKSRKFDPLYVDSSERNGIYQGYYCSYSMGMDTGNGNLQRLGKVAIQVAVKMLIHAPEDFLWFSDENDVTFQFVKKSDGEYWCEFPEPEREGSFGTHIEPNRLHELLRNLPEDLGQLRDQLDLEFAAW